jgi:hypothetical protein
MSETKLKLNININIIWDECLLGCNAVILLVATNILEKHAASSFGGGAWEGQNWGSCDKA